MARFVLVYFKRDEDAREFVQFAEFKERRVVGVYRDPQHKPCDCGNDVFKVHRSWGFHKRYGWHIHKKCGRISRNWRAGYGKRMFQVFGRNLLPMNQTPKIFRDWQQELDASRDR